MYKVIDSSTPPSPINANVSTTNVRRFIAEKKYDQVCDLSGSANPLERHIRHVRVIPYGTASYVS